MRRVNQLKRSDLNGSGFERLEFVRRYSLWTFDSVLISGRMACRPERRETTRIIESAPVSVDLHFTPNLDYLHHGTMGKAANRLPIEREELIGCAAVNYAKIFVMIFNSIFTTFVNVKSPYLNRAV